MYFCSFVIKSNEASSKYSPRCTQQFSYDVHWWTVPQDFHKPSPIRNFPTFIYRTFFLCWFLLFSALEISKNPLKDIKKLLGSENPSHTSVFRFKQNYFFGRQPLFFPHWNLPPKVHVVSSSPDDPPETELGLQQYYLQDSFLLIVISFLRIWISEHQSQEKVYAILMSSEKNPCTVHFIKNPYFWWPPHFSQIKTCLQESEKDKDNFEKDLGKFPDQYFSNSHKIFSLG